MAENKPFTNEMIQKLNNLMDSRMKPFDMRLGQMEQNYFEMRLELTDIRKEIKMSDKLLRLAKMVDGQSEQIKKLREMTEQGEWLAREECLGQDKELEI